VEFGSVCRLVPEYGPVVGIGDGSDLSGEAGVGHRIAVAVALEL